MRSIWIVQSNSFPPLTGEKKNSPRGEQKATDKKTVYYDQSQKLLLVVVAISRMDTKNAQGQDRIKGALKYVVRERKEPIDRY
jgi:signal recognition particle receptor subunit beta